MQLPIRADILVGPLGQTTSTEDVAMGAWSHIIPDWLAAGRTCRR
jgi:hypothetical protein